MYDDYDLDHIINTDHCLDEDTYYEHSCLDHYNNDYDDYDRSDNNYQELAYKHYA